MINAEWHQANRMPKNPSPAQRLQWHTAHAANCECRKMTESQWQALEQEANQTTTDKGTAN